MSLITINTGLSDGQVKDIMEAIKKVTDFIIINNQKQVQTMALIDDVQSAVSALQASIDAKQAAIATAIASLEAQIAAGAGATPAQLQSVLDGLNAAKADVDSTPTA